MSHHISYKGSYNHTNLHTLKKVPQSDLVHFSDEKLDKFSQFIQDACFSLENISVTRNKRPYTASAKMIGGITRIQTGKYLLLKPFASEKSVLPAKKAEVPQPQKDDGLTEVAQQLKELHQSDGVDYNKIVFESLKDGMIPIFAGKVGGDEVTRWTPGRCMESWGRSGSLGTGLKTASYSADSWKGLILHNLTKMLNQHPRPERNTGLPSKRQSKSP